MIKFGFTNNFTKGAFLFRVSNSLQTGHAPYRQYDLILCKVVVQ